VRINPGNLHIQPLTAYLVFISFLFSAIAYWLSNFQPTAQAFFNWVMWLFLDLVAAESLVVFVSSLFPVFVISLALTAFANGLWMSVAGFLISPKILNVFWRYVFHYIDYQVRFEHEKSVYFHCFTLRETMRSTTTLHGTMNANVRY